ncbi:MAG: arylesterase [Burkholderiales bacterium PBB6]|nr:MAG: arylesterase [Burkholderiales bacterium PBB6]
MSLKDLAPRTRRQLLLQGALPCLAWHCSALAALTPAAATAAPTSTRVLIVGDSLSAEYGLARGTGWAALLAERLRKERPGVEVVNASISGDTTSGGRARLAPLLTQHKPTVVVIELGGNDALRGMPLQSTRDNLRAMSQAAKAAGAKVLLVGMQVPPNYGRSYTEEFSASFAQVAKAEGAALVPFMLKGIADQADAERWFQADRIHPKAEAHPLILANIWPALQPLLR